MSVERTRVDLVTEADVPDLVAVLRDNWPFLAPFEPQRDPAYFTEEYQLGLVRHLLAEHAHGRAVPLAIRYADRLVGRITLSDIVRGPFQSATVGYFVAEAVNGRGVATEAVARAASEAFGPLGLHRLQAATLLSNTASQAVLKRNGFERIGLARRYLRIAGRWQDHVLYQLIRDENPAGAPAR
ncbi:GNAT family N-acetyltransferase [Kineococcus gynurae]|uniref:GNAT family N-acetyltransferase n=1 Tax=Kineococcus gynurae TaxID=452979 RepID=A0ABV5LV20_9ACTN